MNEFNSLPVPPVGSVLRALRLGSWRIPGGSMPPPPASSARRFGSPRHFALVIWIMAAASTPVTPPSIVVMMMRSGFCAVHTAGTPLFPTPAVTPSSSGADGRGFRPSIRRPLRRFGSFPIIRNQKRLSKKIWVVYYVMRHYSRWMVRWKQSGRGCGVQGLVAVAGAALVHLRSCESKKSINF